MKRRCIKCDRTAINHARTLCAVHMAELVSDAIQGKKEKEYNNSMKLIKVLLFTMIALSTMYCGKHTSLVMQYQAGSTDCTISQVIANAELIVSDYADCSISGGIIDCTAVSNPVYTTEESCAWNPPYAL